MISNFTYSYPGTSPKRTAYGHLGWRKIDNDYYYLHVGGAIGAHEVLGDVEVTVSGPLKAFILPEPPEGDALGKRSGRRSRSSTSPGLVRRAPLGKFDSFLIDL